MNRIWRKGEKKKELKCVFSMVWYNLKSWVKIRWMLKMLKLHVCFISFHLLKKYIYVRMIAF